MRNSDYHFDAEKEKNRLVEWIRCWFEENGKESPAVIGVSGGKDSSVVSALCVEALGKERVIGVLMPNGEQKDISDSYKIVNHLGIKHVVVNIADAYNSLLPDNANDLAKTNLAPRLRMSALYAVSQANNGRVVNTSNLSEYMAGWFTKNGDECGDLKPLVNLTCTEVVAIGHVLGLPDELVEKKPADGLSESDDETKLGFKYSELDALIRGYKDVDDDVRKKIVDKFNKTSFKRKPAGSFKPMDETNFLVSK